MSRVCLPSLCSNCSFSCARVLRIKEACLKTQAWAGISTPSGYFTELLLHMRIRAEVWIYTNVTLQKQIAFPSYTPNSPNGIRSTNQICYCNWVLLQACFFDFFFFCIFIIRVIYPFGGILRSPQSVLFHDCSVGYISGMIFLLISLGNVCIVCYCYYCP